MAEIKIYGTLVNDTNEAIVKSTQVAAVKQDGTAATQSAVNADLYAKYAAVGNAYRVKGTKATIAEVTALTTKAVGDVWNVTAEFTLNDNKYPAGTNVVWTGSEWDPLGGTVDLAALKEFIPTDIVMYNGSFYLGNKTQGPMYKTSIQKATTAMHGFMSLEDKTKLTGIENFAQINVIENIKINGTVLSRWSDKSVNIYLATEDRDGAMSKEDKSKLNGIAPGAQVNVIEQVKVNGTALSVASKAVNIDLSAYALAAKTLHVADITSTATAVNLKLRAAAGETPICNVNFTAATSTAAGLMSAADKQKLDACASNADLNALKARVAELEALLTLQ